MGIKRKADDVLATEDNGHGSTIFVSNLSYTTTQESLQAAFDDIAPVKTCFIVHEKSAHQDDATSSAASAKGPSKGVGYVTFAIKEDAESVVTRFGESPEELKIDGRAIRVKWADRKPTKGSVAEPAPVKTSANKKPQAERKTQPPVKVNDPDAIRTIMISNLPLGGLNTAMLWKKIRKYTGAEKVVWPVGDDNSIAHAIFDTPSHAAAAQSRLHAHVYKGSTLSVVLKKRSDLLFKSRQKAAEAASSTTILKPSRAGRVIVRNVPWNVTEDDLRALFTPYGPIHSVTIPKAQQAQSGEANANPDDPTSMEPTPSTSKTLARGFAFVWFLSQPDASRAIEKANGATLYAGYAADVKFANKSQIEGKRKIRKKMKSEDARVIAVDWALSKEKWTEAQKALKENQSVDGGDDAMEVDEEYSALLGDDDDEHWTDEDLSDSDAKEGSSVGDSDADEDEDAMSLDDDTSHHGEHPPQPEEGATLFIRNVPFEATDDDIKTLFQAFGPIRYARVTMDLDTGRSRGTGFVSFWKLEDANKCIEEAERMRIDLDPELNAKKNPFTLLTVDPSSSRAARLVLHGRTLDVTVAVSRDRAEKLRETGERAREKKDTRHLYLMREGVIFPSSPAASTLTKAELERRQQSFQARRTLLRTNPSLYISKTRLSIRNVPTWVSERGLKRLAIHAKRAFDDEVKAGTRLGLIEDELEEDPEPGATSANPKDGKDSPEIKKKSKKPKGRPTGVKQTKIVRQVDRVDPLTGKGRSKGYGFIEMDTHADALRVLRWANNNREAHKLLWTWWRNDEVPELALGVKDQLKMLANGGKGKDGEQETDAAKLASRKEELEVRAKKLETRIAEMKSHQHDIDASIKDGRTLHIEFSVENVLVVKRRHDKEAGAHSSGGERAAPSGKSKFQQDDQKRSSPKVNADSGEPPSKRAKFNKSTKPSKSTTLGDDSEQSPKQKEKKGSSIGGLIGKKRKARKLAGGK